MYLVGMAVISGPIVLKWMLANVEEGRPQMGRYITDVSMFLKFEDFAVYDYILWSFHVRGFYIIGQI